MTTFVRVPVEGAALTVQVRGDGAPILFVHGFPLDQSMWTHQLAGFSAWRRIAPDLRGAGDSEAPTGEYSMARYADDLVMVLDAVGAERAVCCGLSMGGYILFELMRRHPERVRALVLCDTKAEADTPQGKQGREELAALAEREGVAPVAERLLPKLLGLTTRSRDLRLVETVRAMVLRSPVTGVAGALRAMRDRPDSTALLGEIRVPTLVVAGAEDELTPPAVMQPMARRIREARYVEVPSAGHLTPLERPDAVNEVLRDFLASL